MTVNQASMTSNSKYKNSLMVRTISGARVTPGMLTEVREDQIRLSLNKSLLNSGMLAKSNEHKKYDLDVEIVGVTQPSISADVEVTVNVYYTITGATGKKRFLIIGNGYAAFTEYLIAGPRVRFATERAIQNNFKNLITELELDK